MMRRISGFLFLLCLSAVFACTLPFYTEAAQVQVKTSTDLYARIEAPNAVARRTAGNSGMVVSRLEQGEILEVSGTALHGWIKVITSKGAGYIPASQVTLFEKTREEMDASVLRRQQVVDYALQFLGGRYVYGGSDPHSGADCSGFTRYIMRHAAGIALDHSSASQANAGVPVDIAVITPGDLVFYGGQGYIDHVAIYIGGGQIVHASSVKTGIKISDLYHRTPVKAVNVLN